LLSFSAVRLLVIETDDLFRSNVAERLRLESYKVYEACQEIEARKVIERKNIDVVLLGLRGLRQRGLTFLKGIKKFRPLIEVILIIPSEEISLSIEGMKLGAFDDILMPFDMETLLDRIQAAYRQKKEREGDGRTRIHNRQDRLIMRGSPGDEGCKAGRRDLMDEKQHTPNRAKHDRGP
jgi:DNA-binding NtrC family response regulator